MTWVVVLAVGAGSFVFRLGPLLLFQRICSPSAPTGDSSRRNRRNHRVDRRVDQEQRHRDGRACRRCWRWPPGSFWPFGGPRCCAWWFMEEGSTSARNWS